MKLESMGHRRLSRQLAAVLASREADEVIGAALRVLGERARFQSALASRRLSAITYASRWLEKSGKSSGVCTSTHKIE